MAALCGLAALGAGAGNPRPGRIQAAAQEGVRVWVNTSSHVYHCSGTRYYGATKRGAYSSETEARAQGNRPAYGKACGPLPNSGDAPSRGPQGAARAPSSPNVWVNLSSSVYHCEGSRYYEATKRGRGMSESDAQAAGYRPAYGKACS